MTFWSGDKIKAAFAEPANIVTPYHEFKVDCSAYTLTLGEECFVTPDHETKPRDNMQVALSMPNIEEHDGIQQKTGGGSIVIPAGQFAFLLTEEFLHIPDNVMGFISLKSKVKWKGLINVSGFHVDPGFRGRLVYSVYNAGPTPINLSRGQDLFLLWLADLDESASPTFSRAEKAPNLEISNELISTVNSPTLSVQNLSDKIKRLENKINTILAVLSALATLASLGFAAVKLMDSKQPSSVTPPSANSPLGPKPLPVVPQKSGVGPVQEGASANRP